jgi:hypothetical protein
MGALSGGGLVGIRITLGGFGGAIGPCRAKEELALDAISASATHSKLRFVLAKCTENWIPCALFGLVAANVRNLCLD